MNRFFIFLVFLAYCPLNLAMEGRLETSNAFEKEIEDIVLCNKKDIVYLIFSQFSILKKSNSDYGISSNEKTYEEEFTKVQCSSLEMFKHVKLYYDKVKEQSTLFAIPFNDMEAAKNTFLATPFNHEDYALLKQTAYRATEYQYYVLYNKLIADLYALKYHKKTIKCLHNSFLHLHNLTKENGCLSKQFSRIISIISLYSQHLEADPLKTFSATQNIVQEIGDIHSLQCNVNPQEEQLCNLLISEFITLKKYLNEFENFKFYYKI